MTAAKFLPPLLAAATLLLLGANALPSVNHKHRLRKERTRLVRELEAARKSEATLNARIHALRNDSFFLERMLVET